MILDIVKEKLGRRRKISRQEMAEILSQYHNGGGELCGEAIGKLISPDESESEYVDRTIKKWVEFVKGITLVSITQSLTNPHGDVRHDQPGTIAPGSKFSVLFCSGDVDAAYIRTKAERVIILDDSPPRPSGWIAITPTPALGAQNEAERGGSFLDQNAAIVACISFYRQGYKCQVQRWRAGHGLPWWTARRAKFPRKSGSGTIELPDGKCITPTNEGRWKDLMGE
jgi:hypothetical protein